MAYGKKYTINFYQTKDYGDGDDDWSISIYKDGYVGAVTDLYTEQNSIVLRRDGGQFEWVNGTKLSFGLYNLTEEQYIEFRDASYGDYWIQAVRGKNIPTFVGYNQSEIYTESYEDVPYSAKLEFTCGLSHLKYVRFDDSGTLYSGQKALIEVIRLCLNKLPNPIIGVKEFINVYEDSINSTTTDSMLAQIYVNSNLYREEKDGVEVGMTCHQVLTEILKCFNAHLFFYDNFWYIIRWQEYSDAAMYYRGFNPNVGSEDTLTVNETGNFTSNKRIAGQPDGTLTELVITNESELSIEPPLNRIRLTYNQEQQEVSNFQLISNGCMQNFTPNNYTGKPTQWSYTGIDPDTYNAIFPLNGQNWFQFDDLDAASYVSTKYIKQTRYNLYISTSDRLSINLKGFQRLSIDRVSNSANYNNLNFFLSGNWQRQYSMIIKIGAYYLRGNGSNYGTWTTTPSVFTYYFKFSNVQMPFWETTYIASVYDNFIIYTAALPLSGFQDIEMTFLQPCSNVVAQNTLLTDFDIAVTEFGISCASVIYEPNQSSAITDYTVYQEIDEDEDVLELSVLHGDGLYDFSLNSFRLSDGTVTNNWNRRGKTDNLNIFSMILKQYAELRGSFVRMLSGKVITQMKAYNTIQHTINGTDYHYMIQDYSYNLETNEWDVNLMEIANYTALTLSTATTSKYVGNPETPPTEVKELTDSQNSTNVVEDSSIIFVNQYDINNYI